MVLDTDTFNEIDDQFAVVYALTSPEAVEVEAFYAAPFFNELSEGPADGMEKSYQELQNILSIMGRQDIPTYRGSTAYLSSEEEPVESEGARDLVERAMASDPSDPLYVVAIGAITNAASAILMKPEIIERIVLVWLGGHNFEWPDTREFNLYQDVHAANVILDSGVPFIIVPCLGVASQLSTTLPELRDYIKEEGKIGRYLFETYENCSKNHFAYSRVIWDISVIAWLVQPEWCPSVLVHAPRVSSDGYWVHNRERHLIRYVRFIHRDSVFRDLFTKIAAEASQRTI